MPVVYIELQDEILVTCVTAVMPAVNVCASFIQHKYSNPFQISIVNSDSLIQADFPENLYSSKFKAVSR